MTGPGVSDRSDDPLPETARFWTVANILCLVRLFGSPVVAALAWFGHENAFIGLFVFLVLTDWVDGKLARWLKQRSVFGAKLDSMADVTLYVALGLAIIWLRPQLIASTWPWVASAAGSYALSVIVCAIKFRKMPSYHTRAAKIGWFATSVAALAVLFFPWHWPIVLVGVYVTLSNLEATAISFRLRTWQSDVPTLYHAWRRSAALQEGAAKSD